MKFRPSHRRRADICAWLRKQNNVYSVVACGEGMQCPALSQAKFGWHVEGDTLGSQRLMDTLLSGTVPIFTHPGQYDILPSWIDWHSISVYVNADRPSTFFRFLRRVVKGHQTYRDKRNQIVRNERLFDWTTLAPFDTYMYTIARQVVPLYQTRANSAPFPILRLDEMEEIEQPEEFVSCGDHDAPRCGLCARSDGEFLCSGQCKWCEYGPVDDGDLVSPTEQCVPKRARCRLPGDWLAGLNDREKQERAPV